MMSGYISDCLGENFSCIQPKPILPQKFNWDVFMATLIPTEGCNFQCSYCHKNHPAASMTRDTLDQIEEYITAQAPRHKQVVLAWLGGEPILCKDTVLEVSEMIQNLQKQHGFQYTAKMTTNGYLLDEKLFRQFCQAGITSYQITLDGWNHDKTRPHVSGKGTLRTIIDNLVALSKLPPEEYSFHITLRRNLLAGDEDYSWYDYLYRLFGQDKRFDVLVCAVGDWGGKPADRVDDPDIAEKMAAEAEGIFLWAFEGLQRLVRNGFKFTESDRARQNRELVKRDNNNFFDFMEAEDYIRLKADACISSKDLYTIYKMWCEENNLVALKARSFSDAVIANLKKYNLEHTNNIANSAGRRVWGYLGIEALVRPEMPTSLWG